MLTENEINIIVDRVIERILTPNGLITPKPQNTDPDIVPTKAKDTDIITPNEKLRIVIREEMKK